MSKQTVRKYHVVSYGEIFQFSSAHRYREFLVAATQHEGQANPMDFGAKLVGVVEADITDWDAEEAETSLRTFDAYKAPKARTRK